jgi:organic hydroperoxide reductase OsmC/OhrA
VKQHHYEVSVEWAGNLGEGTKSYRSFSRNHQIAVPGKPSIPGSSDPSFRGDRTRYNPEELLVAALSTCHMLWYLHLCSENHITVLEYTDAAQGVMQEHPDGAGEFIRVQLRPTVKIAAGDDREKAIALHEKAHHYCFIARSVKFPVDAAPEIIHAEP